MLLKSISSWTESERRVYNLFHEMVRLDPHGETSGDEVQLFDRFVTMGVGLSCWGFFGTVRSALAIDAGNRHAYV